MHACVERLGRFGDSSSAVRRGKGSTFVVVCFEKIDPLRYGRHFDAHEAKQPLDECSSISAESLGGSRNACSVSDLMPFRRLGTEREVCGWWFGGRCLESCSRSPPAEDAQTVVIRAVTYSLHCCHVPNVLHMLQA